jgi:hypothetical protein
MDFDQNINTNQKALKINLDRSIYGSFAEIGAGQETAALFFKAGGASGTIAKTMSAYDMTFSDAIYGKEENGRYVCEPRLVKMIAKEYGLVEQRLGEQRGDNTCFFAFATTVTTVNYTRTVQGHGWLGIRFQTAPNMPPNDAIIHVRMHDKDALQQQQAYGILGVNLMYACYHHHDDVNKFVVSLLDNLSRERVEVDMIRLAGPIFEEWDDRLVALKLVRFGLTDAAMFDPTENMIMPADALYKKNILVLRGRFRPVTHVNMDMFRRGKEQFLKNVPPEEHGNTVLLAELTLQDLKATQGDIDEKDFLDRVDILCSLGQTVMVSNYHEHHKLVNYLSLLTRKKIAVVMGRIVLEQFCQEKNYIDLKGGVLEAFSRLFINDLHIYVYPYRDANGVMQNAENFVLPSHIMDLYRYLRSNYKITDIEGYNPDVLHILSDNVLKMIKENDEGWEKMVPEEVSKTIKDNCLFGFPCVLIEQKKEFYLRT